MNQPPEEPWSWDLPEASEAGTPPSQARPPEADPAATEPRRAHAEAAGPGDFRRTVLLTVAGAAVPGLGLIAARRRVVGAVVLGVFATAVLIVAGWAIVDPAGLASVAVQPAMLMGLCAVLIVTAVIWVGVVVASHLALRGRPTPRQRKVGGVLVGLLAFAVAAPFAVGANLSYVQANTVSSVFRSEKSIKSATRPTLTAPPAAPGKPAVDPWAKKPRLNVLLLGGDADRNRVGTRTDTVILASIDTKTGDTTLFSLPRNTGRMPFPAKSPLHDYYPYGFTNGDGNNAEYFLNAMYNNVPATVPKDILGGTDNLGADVLKLSVGAALGLQVDYYVLINLRGFTQLVDALGGITLNVNSYIPIGGNTDLHIPPKDYISPGANQHLKGREALWFARGRYGTDDYVRMGRQRCVINAVIQQANPTNMVTRYEKIAAAGKEIVQTDIPQEVLPLMVNLSLRVKDGNIRSVLFEHGSRGFLSPNPDFELMREQVKTALGESKKAKKSTSSAKPKKSPSAQPTTASQDVADICAFDAEAAASARIPG